MHQVVAQHSLPDMGLYQVGESPIPCQGASLADLNHAWSWQATHPPPTGGSDCTLWCKLAFRTGKNVPSMAIRGSDACD